MIINLAWKNIWRNPIRSGVVISAVATGIWALMFIIGFVKGMVMSYVNVSIETRTSHIQMHHPEFVDDPEVENVITDLDTVLMTLTNMDEIRLVSPRLITYGLVSSASGGQGVMVKGVVPETEALLTKLNEKVKEGEYLDVDRRNAILISSGLAKKLGVSLHQHVVLSFQGLHGDFVSGRFRISGWYDTGNIRFDDAIVYVRFQDLQSIGEMKSNTCHELAITLNDIDFVPEVKEKLMTLFPFLAIRSYEEISPDLAMYNEQIKTSMMIIIVVIMLALLFGIINTMLMAVLERTKELGMLMAIGMNRWKLFLMIMLESILMCFVSVPAGLLLGHLTIKGLSIHGINLSEWASGLEQFGMQTIIRPQLDAHIYSQIAIALVITSLVAGIYPAIKAINTKPAVALRNI